MIDWENVKIFCHFQPSVYILNVLVHKSLGIFFLLKCFIFSCVLCINSLSRKPFQNHTKHTLQSNKGHSCAFLYKRLCIMRRYKDHVLNLEENHLIAYRDIQHCKKQAIGIVDWWCTACVLCALSATGVNKIGRFFTAGFSNLSSSRVAMFLPGYCINQGLSIGGEKEF